MTHTDQTYFQFIAMEIFLNSITRLCTDYITCSISLWIFHRTARLLNVLEHPASLCILLWRSEGQSQYRRDGPHLSQGLQGENVHSIQREHMHSTTPSLLAWLNMSGGPFSFYINSQISSISMSCSCLMPWLRVILVVNCENWNVDRGSTGVTVRPR